MIRKRNNILKSSVTTRFIVLISLTILAWGGVYLIDTPSEQQILEENKSVDWPPLATWRVFKMQRKAMPDVLMTKTHDLNDPQAIAWSVKLVDQTLRPLDPLLQARLEEELTSPTIIETRSLIDETDIRQLGLTNVALKISIQTDEQEEHRFLIGAEHLRHSTWVRPIDANGKAKPIAWRMSGRLRRALDHIAHKWPDRRVSIRNQSHLTQINCFQGTHETIPVQRRRAWTMIKQNNQWGLATTDRSPTLHAPSVQSFIYTLSSLRVARFISHEDLPAQWRPTSTCFWFAEGGEEGWLSFGQATIALNNEQVNVVKSKYGIGLIPNYIAHFLAPQFNRFLSRRLSLVETDHLQKIIYTPAPSPLVASTLRQKPWRMEKLKTGWWLMTGQDKAPISQSRFTKFFNMLKKESAQVIYRPAFKTTDQVTGARVRFFMTPTFCQSSKELKPQADCSFDLTEILTDGDQSLKRWVREQDGLIFSLTPSHHRDLVSAAAL